MSADADNGNDDGGEFAPQAIRRRLPAALTKRQERAMICAIRNPDAGFQSIGTACGVNYSTVKNALESFATGLVGAHHSGEWITNRDGTRQAHSLDELTEKQQAIVEFLARNPSFDPEARTGKEFLAAIKSGLDDPPAMSSTYPHKIAQQYAEFVEERRDQLLATGEDFDDDTDPDEIEAFDPRTPREYLRAAGVTDLPESNLDSLDEYGDTAAVPDDERLDRAFKNAATSATSVSLDLPADAFEDHRGEDREDFDDDDVVVGNGYLGVVNGKVDWGLWVTIAGDPEYPSDVSGVIPVEKLRAAGHTLDEYAVGDAIHVVATGRSNVGDGKVRHRFDIPTINRLPAKPTRTPETPEDAPQADAADAESDTTDETTEAATATTDAESDDAESDDDVVPVLERYWRYVDLVRYLRDRMKAEGVTKDAVHESPLVREYHLAMARKHDAKEDVRATDGIVGLPVYKNRRETPRWDYEVVDLRRNNADPAFVPTDFEVPTEDADADERDVAEYVGTLADHLDGVTRRLDSIEDRLGTVENRTEGHTNSLKDLRENRLDSIEDRLDELDAAQADAGPRDLSLTDAIAALEQAGVEYEIRVSNEKPTRLVDTILGRTDDTTEESHD